MGGIITTAGEFEVGGDTARPTYLSAGVLPVKAETVVDPLAGGSFTEVYEAAADRHQLRPWDWNSGEESDAPPVAIDALSTEYQSRIPKEWSESQINMLNDSETGDEWEDNFAQFEHRNGIDDYLGRQGMSGIGIELLAALTDPVAIGTIVATEGIAAPWVAGTKIAQSASVLDRVRRAAVVGGVTEGALAAARAQQEADYTAQDAMYAVLVGSALGAPFGLLGGKAPLEDLAKDALSKSKLTLAQAIEDGEVERIGRSVGAAEDIVPQDTKKGKYRIDERGRSEASPNAPFRNAMAGMLEDGVAGGKTTVALEVDTQGKHFYARLYRTSVDNFNAYAKDAGVGRWRAVDRARMRQEFSNAVYRDVVGGSTEGLSEAGVKAVRATSSEIRKINRELLTRAKAAGVRGLKDVEVNDNYMARYWDANSFRKSLSEHSPQKVATVIYKSLLSNAAKSGDEVDTTLLARIAMGFTNNMDKRVNAHAKSLNEILEDTEELGDFLREFAPEGTEVEHSGLMRLATTTKTSKAKTDVIDRAKSRMDLDMNIEHEGLSILDLVDKDAVGGTHRYIASMVGHTAFANKMGIKSPSDWKATVGTVRAGNKNGDSLSEVEKLEQMRKVLLGQPIWGGGLPKTQQVMRTIGKMNFTAAMGKAYFAAFGEMARVVSNNGLLTTMKHVPQLTTIFKSMAKPTHRGDGIAREVNEYFGAIGDEHLMTLWGRYDDNLISDSTATSGFLNRLEITAHGLSNVMANQLAPLAPVDRALRQVAFAANTSSLYNHLVKGAKIKWDLKELDLDEGVLLSIKKELQANAKLGKLGGVETLNIQAWDSGVADMFMERLTRFNARQVQRSLIGESNILATHPIGRMVTQFRTFLLDSYTKMFLNDGRKFGTGKGMLAAQNIMWGGAFASAQYAARVYASSIGREDREEYLAARLDYTASPFEEGKGLFWANALNYTPSLGAPVSAYNTLADMTPLPELQVNRSTGYASSLLGFPTSESIERMGDVSRAISKDGKLDANGWRKAATFIPFNNTVLGGSTINYLLSDK